MKKHSLGLEISNSIICGLIALVSLICAVYFIKIDIIIIIHFTIIIIASILSCIKHALSDNLEGKEILERISVSFHFLLPTTYALLFINKMNKIIISIICIISLIQIIMNSIFYKKIIIPNIIISIIMIWIPLLSMILIDIFEPITVFIQVIFTLLISISLIIYLLSEKKEYCHLLTHILNLIVVIIQILFIINIK